MFSAMDVAKALLDNGIHPPTMYFPLIVHEALMVEPTETEPREVLDHASKYFAAPIRLRWNNRNPCMKCRCTRRFVVWTRLVLQEIQSFVFPLNKLFLSGGILR